MLRAVLAFMMVGFLELCALAQSFVLDRALNITYFSFLLFGIFMAIVLRVINQIKQVQEVESQREGTYKALQDFNEYKHYEKWLWRHKKK